MNLRGSHTLEAAILLPLVFYILIAFMYTTFFIHDLIMIEVYTHEIIINEQELLDCNAIILKDITYQSKVVDEEISITIKANINIPFKIVKNLTGINDELTIRKSRSVQKNTSFVRKWSVYINTGKRLIDEE